MNPGLWLLVYLVAAVGFGAGMLAAAAVVDR